MNLNGLIAWRNTQFPWPQWKKAFLEILPLSSLHLWYLEVKYSLESTRKFKCVQVCYGKECSMHYVWLNSSFVLTRIPPSLPNPEKHSHGWDGLCFMQLAQGMDSLKPRWPSGFLPTNWASLSSSLNLGLFICKVEIIMGPASQSHGEENLIDHQHLLSSD